MKTSNNLIAGMREAMSLLQQDGPGSATVNIQQTLRGLMPAGARVSDALAPGALRDIAPAQFRNAGNAGGASRLVPDLLARWGIDAPLDGPRFELRALTPQVDVQQDDRPLAPGNFLAGSFSNHASTRAYKLYVPTAYRGQPLPLVVMLHGCTQTPDDFAAGTRFNTLAEEEPCLVLYPAQAQSANGSRCWNWFSAVDQQRDRGEPSVIAGMTQEIVETYGLDPIRVYIGGLSAGGAMALVMANTYPELYAAVGIHSGVPYAAAHDLPSAFAAMKGAGTPVANECLKGKPIIVFHGDRDDTVHPINSDRIVAQTTPPRGAAQIKKGQAGGGYAYTQTLHEDPDGKVLAEQWTVHGAGHAWSGGSRRGSFTDGKGPDASREMMRFFATQSKQAAL
jgi:poly(hydroxyalkanoate) depolymerase family esterase